MSDRASFIFHVSMDVDADKEALFNEVYDQEHVPFISSVPGVLSAKRYKIHPRAIPIGDKVKQTPDEGTPTYHVVYEIEDPSVLDSVAWAQQAEKGRWPSEVRPYTRNRHHSIWKKLG